MIVRKYFVLACFLLSGCASMKEATYRTLNERQNQTFVNWQRQYHQTKEFDEDLSLDEAVDIAFSYNKKINAAIQQKDLAKAKILESASHFFPNVMAIGAYTYLEEQPKVGDEGDRVPVGERSNYSFTLQARQPLFHGGAINSGFKGASYFSYLTDETIEAEYQRLYFEVAKAYLDILLAEKLLAVQKQAVESAKAHLNEVQIKEKEGVVSSYDILRSEVEVTNFEAEAIKQKNRVSLSKTSFLKFLGMNQEYALNLQNILQFKPFEIDKETAMRTAILNRPDLKGRDFEVKMQKQSVNIARSQYFPQIDAIFDQRWGRPDPHLTTLDKWGREWVFRVQLNWDILDFGRKLGMLRQEKAGLRQKEFLLKDIQESVSLEVQQALFNLEDANAFVMSQKLDLIKAKKALELAQTGYQQGVKTEVDVTDALSAMTRSQSLHYQAIYQYNLATIQLHLVMGTLKRS